MKFIKFTVLYTLLMNMVFISYLFAETNKHEALVTEYIKLAPTADFLFLKS